MRTNYDNDSLSFLTMVVGFFVFGIPVIALGTFATVATIKIAPVVFQLMCLLAQTAQRF